MDRKAHFRKLRAEAARYRDQLFKKQNGVCALCNERMTRENKGSQRYATVDHIIPLSKGGSNLPFNLQLACRRCNQEKSNYLVVSVKAVHE